MGKQIAFLFPGQGSQSVGMGQQLVESHPEAREIFERADEALGFALSRLCFEGPMEELTATRNAQPAILTHSLAVHAVLRSKVEVSPRLVAGHSLGEISAAAAMGALSLEDAVRLVRARGELMWEAGQRRPGTMAAVVGLDAEVVEEVCSGYRQEHGGVVVLANLNSPGQLVISGEVDAVEGVAGALKEAGARRVLPLPVSGAFHSPLMVVVQKDFEAVLSTMEVEDPMCPVVSNVTAQPVDRGDEFARGLVRQLVSPVRWYESVRTMVEAGVEVFLEVGPQKVLSNLGSRDFREQLFLPTSPPEGLEKVLATLEKAM